MKGLILQFPSAEVRGDFKKSFLINAKKSKAYEKAFIFSDIEDKMLGIELDKEVDGALSCALVTIKGHDKIKLSGVGLCRIDPIDLPEGTSVIMTIGGIE